MASLQISDVIFKDNIAQEGAAIFFQSLEGGRQLLNNIVIDFKFGSLDLEIPVQSQIHSTYAGLAIQNITVVDLTTPFLSHNGGGMEIDGLYMKNITCRSSTVTFSFCIFELVLNAGETLDFSLNNFTLVEVDTVAPLIVSQGATLSLTSVDISDIRSTANVSVAMLNDSSIELHKVNLLNITSTFITATNCHMKISETIFSNENQTNLVSPNTFTQFIVMSNSEILVTSSEFTFNSISSPSYGGVIFPHFLC